MLHSPHPAPNRPFLWDIFCKVIDNYGDAGVTWRLARQLVTEQSVQVRLWIDDLTVLAKLVPEINPHLSQQVVTGVELQRWNAAMPECTPGDVVIEAFGCPLPEAWLAAMAARKPQPSWFNLEYLSAEDWVERIHRLPSPHPRWPLTQQFFCPGFTGATGGLLREADLLTRRARFDAAARDALLRSLGVPLAGAPLIVSMFCYPSAPLLPLLEAWRAGPRPMVCLMAEGVGTTALRQLGSNGGNLRIIRLPFLPQAGFDELLWACDLNFVRGEDSFLRAQWAGLPLVWQIYEQDDHAHHAKLGAFLDRYLAPAPELQALADLHWVWNGRSGEVSNAWRRCEEMLPALTRHAERWATALAQPPDLASQLLAASTVAP